MDNFAKNLMINDWIYHDWMGQGKVVKLNTLNGATVIEMQQKDGYKTILNKEPYFQPIEITKEILELNEDEVGSDAFSWQPYKKDGFLFSIHSTDCTFSNCDFTGQLKYVHEIQHVLRLCGFNQFADDFKIE
jgi:hypothetical protein